MAHAIVAVPRSQGLAFLFRVGDILLMDLKDACNPVCMHRTLLCSPFHVLEVLEETFRIDGDDEGFIAARALLELRDYGMDNKGDDPMSIDSDINGKPKYMCSWTCEAGNQTNLRMIFSAETGEFFSIEIVFDPDGPRMSLSDCLYHVSPAKLFYGLKVAFWLQSWRWEMAWSLSWKMGG